MATSEAIPNFEFDKVLDKLLVGQGAYDKIFKGKWGSHIVALKVFSFAEDDDIIKEAKFLSRLNHLNHPTWQNQAVTTMISWF